MFPTSGDERLDSAGAVAVEDTARPYKGAKSYQAEDAALFFGRDDEAEALLGLILSGRTTLLYAPSGAGKTSLLNALVLPGLEAEGWLPVRVRLGDNPVRAVRDAVLQSAVMHPEIETRALSRTLAALVPQRDMTLAEALHRYDKLPEAAPARRGLIAPLHSPELTVAGLRVAAPAEIVPFFSRLLRSTVSLEQYIEHLRQLAGPEEAAALGRESSLIELRQLLDSEALAAQHERLLGDLAVPAPGLAAFFQHFCAVGEAYHPRFALVLVLDQFEEIFTRFYDPGPARPEESELPDWRLRWRFFSELESLFRARQPAKQALGEEGPEVLRPLPLRLVISMREEYLGQLGPLRDLEPDLDQRAYRLSLLGLDEAKVAIRRPAVLYGYDYSTDCFEEIVRDLTKEERFVEPAHLQIVCDRLWDDYGRRLQASTDPNDGEPLAVVEVANLRSLNGVGGILRSFLAEFVDDLEATDQIVALEVLDQLITGGRTRNIVDRESLVEIPFRDRKCRERVLSLLTDRTIVRTEARLGGEFVEVTHEFLIEPILEEVRERLTGRPDYQEFLLALRTLQHWTRFDFRTATQRLPTLEEAARIHAVRDRITWSPLAVELMLRSAIVRGLERPALLAWLHRYEDSVAGEDRIAAAAERLRQGAALTRGQWRAMDSVRTKVPSEPEARRAMLRATLSLAGAAERDSVWFWTKECLRYVD